MGKICVCLANTLVMTAFQVHAFVSASVPVVMCLYCWVERLLFSPIPLLECLLSLDGLFPVVHGFVPTSVASDQESVAEEGGGD